MKRTSSKKELEQAVLKFRRAVMETMLKESKKSGYTVSHLEAIRFLAERHECLLKDIAAHLHITPPSASALVDTLVQKRLVARREGVADRRSVTLVLTPQGRRVLATLHRQKHSVFESLFSKLSESDTEAFINILHKLSS